MNPQLTTYRQAEAWLLSLTDYERLLGDSSVRYNTRNFDIDHFRDQLRLIGDPHLKYAVFHVAGTKGKGSTCAFLESALRQCGLKTGLYTSPHLFKFTERIKINGADIAEDDFCRNIETLRHFMIPEDDGSAQDAAAGSRSFRTVFELLTAAAFSHFAEQQVDVAIIETGLGGRLDSTNVFDQQGRGALVNVITAIGMDHTAILGDSLKAIAAEKAGIIRPHARVIVAPQVNPVNEQTVADVVRQRCEEVGAGDPIFVTCNIDIVEPGESADAEIDPANRTTYKLRLKSKEALHDEPALLSPLVGGVDIRPSLAGRHQAANAATAIVALAQLQAAAQVTAPLLAARLNLNAIIAGIEYTSWPGRFQVVPGAIPIVIDGAHCAISAEALASTCLQHFGDRPAIIITGFLQDKAGSELLGAMFRHVPVVHGIAVAPPTPRAVSADHIRDALLQFLPVEKVQTASDIDAAIETAHRIAVDHVHPYIVVFGSLYLVGPATMAASVD